MAGDDQDQEQKTEEPTQKRLEEALKKGNIPFSREVSSFFMLALLALTVAWLSPPILRSVQAALSIYITEAGTLPADRRALGLLLEDTLLSAAGAIALPLIGAMVAAVAASFIQNGFVLSNEPMMPKLERISPMSGIKRMFSMRSVMEFIKSLLKITVIGVVAFMSVAPELNHIQQLPGSETQSMLLFLAMLATRMTMGVAIAMFFIAIFDVLFQRFQYFKSLRMSRQEIKDEYKQSEGDPHIKQKLRRLRQERARNRMMASVPTADVVITNPTHFAVALKYDGMNMKAPTLVAKGQDLIALRIRDLAKEHNVPVVENPPLARALYSSTGIDEEIPFTHYEAVAKVISYVYRLRGKKY